MKKQGIKKNCFKTSEKKIKQVNIEIWKRR